MAQPPFPQPQPEPNLPGQSAGPGLPQPDGEPRLPEPDWGSPDPGAPRPGGDPEPHTPGRQPGRPGEPGIPGGGGAPGGFEPGAPGNNAPGATTPDGERRSGNAAYGGGNQQPWPPQPRGPERQDNNQPPGNNEPPKPDAPQQVRTAWILYIMAAVATVVASASALLPGGRSVSIDQVREALPGGASDYSDEQIEAASSLTSIIAVILTVVIAAGFLLAARQLFKGKQWARALLTAGSIVLVAMGISAALVLFAGGSPAGAPAQAEPIPNFIDLAASLCAGLFGGTALWQLYTKESTAFFLEHSGGSKF